MVEARFELSAPGLDQCPAGDLPEVAIAGRSNVGKSSLLNALSGHKGLARVSRTPGRTQLLNLFRLRLQGKEGRVLELRCADLPGYGYAAAGRQIRDRFAPMIEGYLSGRDALRGLVLLVDVRRGFGDMDLDLLAFMSDRGLPTLIVGTKADKLGAAQRGLVRRKLASAVGARPADILLTSAATGLGIDQGPDRLVDDIAALVLDSPAADPDEERSA